MIPKPENPKKFREKIKRLKNKADRLWFQAYLKAICEVCNKPAQQLHHFYYKGTYPYIRHLKENGISLCKGCHFTLHFKDPKDIEEKITKKRGKRWLNALKKIRDEKPFNFGALGYYQALIEKLKELPGGKDSTLS